MVVEREAVYVIFEVIRCRVAEVIVNASSQEIARTEPHIGGVASVVTLNFGTGIIGNCGCPCIED